jgi:hypothetical protein
VLTASVQGAGGDHEFVAMLAPIALRKRISGYMGDGQKRWPAMNRLDAGKLVQLAMDKAPPGCGLSRKKVSLRGTSRWP